MSQIHELKLKRLYKISDKRPPKIRVSLLRLI